MARSIGLFLALVAVVGCDDAFNSPRPDGAAPDGGGAGDGGGLITAPVRSCGSEFTFTPSRAAAKVEIGAEWNGWDPSKTPMTGPDPAGAYRVTVDLPKGAHGYKFVLTDNGGTDWLLDPKNPYTKFVGGVENSVREVEDCATPRFAFQKLDRSAQGVMHAEVQFLDGSGGAGLDPAQLQVLLDDAPAQVQISPTALISVDATGLAKTKHRLIFRGAGAEPLHVPFWIEDEPFDYRDGTMYFVFTDRFRDGVAGNTQPAGDVDGRANYQGGDFAGVQAAVEEGYFEQLGVRTLWLSPPNANPDHSETGTGGKLYTGYHGYWPTAGRETQKRFGDLPALKALVKAAHARGMRVIVDSVLNHVHDESPLWTQHQADGWFNGAPGACTCGAPGCDWGARALDCWFQPYLPDVNYQNWDALTTMIDDALFWVEEADIDGFRVDAVKHFEHAASRRLRGKLRDKYEHAGPLFYLVGETFDGDRGLINSYIGENELHAQFDFPLYFTLRDALAYYSTNMRSLESAVKASESGFGSAPMSPFLGNHDVPRFVSMAAGMVWADSQAQAWQDPPGTPPDDAGYIKLRMALTFVGASQGVPLIYYGDEYGQPGAGDPDNRRFMKWTGYNAWETATLEHARRVGQARKELAALRRGSQSTLWIDDDVYVFARVYANQVAVVAINRQWSSRTMNIPVPSSIPLADGTLLKDRLGGASVTVTNGKLMMTLQAHSSQVLAP